MPNNEMDYSLIHRTPDGNGKILVTTPGSPDKGSWETEAELKTYVNQDTVMKTDIVQSLGQQTDKVPSNKAVDDAINAINTRVTNIEETLMGENEITVSYPNDGNYPSLMPNKVPARALKFAEVPRFRGKSRAWGQLAKALNSTNWYEEYGAVVSYSDGVATITPTAKYSRIACDIPYTANHIMLLMGRIKLSNSSDPTSVGLAIYGIDTVVSGTGGCQATTNWQNIFVMLKSTSASPNARVLVRDHRDSDWGTIQATDIVCYDLTLIFGSGNEPSTVADALAQLPALAQYNAYDAGSLVDTVVSGAKSVGVNIWDEEWEVGSLNLSTGANNDSVSNKIRSKNYIPLNYGKEYYVLSPTPATGLYACIYDENKNFLSARLFNNANGLTITPTAEQKYMRFYTAYDATSYSGGIQICLNSYADKTTYHPYKSDTLSLSETVTLRSAGSVSDELDVETGVLTRECDKKMIVFSNDNSLHYSNVWYHVVNKPSDYIGYGTYEALSDLAKRVTFPRCGFDGVFTFNDAGNIGNVRGDMYLSGFCVGFPPNTTVAQANELFADLYFTYALATPSTDTYVDPILDPFIKVEGGGTIETIQQQTPTLDNCLDVTYDIIPQ